MVHEENSIPIQIIDNLSLLFKYDEDVEVISI